MLVLSFTELPRIRDPLKPCAPQAPRTLYGMRWTHILNVALLLMCALHCHWTPLTKFKDSILSQWQQNIKPNAGPCMDRSHAHGAIPALYFCFVKGGLLGPAHTQGKRVIQGHGYEVEGAIKGHFKFCLLYPISFFSFNLFLSLFYSTVACMHIISGTISDGNILKDRVPLWYISRHSFAYVISNT